MRPSDALAAPPPQVLAPGRCQVAHHAPEAQLCMGRQRMRGSGGCLGIVSMRTGHQRVWRGCIHAPGKTSRPGHPALCTHALWGLRWLSGGAQNFENMILPSSCQQSSYIEGAGCVDGHGALSHETSVLCMLAGRMDMKRNAYAVCTMFSFAKL